MALSGTRTHPPVSRPISRRGFLKAGTVAAAGLAIYAGEIERHWIDLVQLEIPIRQLSPAFAGFRIAQISDIHLDEYSEPSFLRSAVEKINALNPDMVLFTGDFVSEGPASIHFARGAAWQCANILDGIKCAERYACLGNHDLTVGADEVIAALIANHIPVLRNRCTPLERSGGRLWLAGLDDPLNGGPRPDLAIPKQIRNRPDEPVILMCHGPDYVDNLLTDPAGSAVDLMLSGHTHGGQVRLPLIGPLTLPKMGQKYVQGHFQLGRLQLYVNRGIGTVGVPFRFDCPPELTLITLRRA
jgi:predicted MPP superfamily phosphohydrolase